MRLGDFNAGFRMKETQRHNVVAGPVGGNLSRSPPHRFSSVAQSCPALCSPTACSTPGLPAITTSRSLLKLTSIGLVMPSNHLILCCPLLLLPSTFPSISVFGPVCSLSMPSVPCLLWVPPTSQGGFLRPSAHCVPAALAPLLGHGKRVPAEELGLSACLENVFHSMNCVIFSVNLICTICNPFFM